MSFVQLSETEITNLISNKKTQITVVGLGKMGIPLAMVFTHAGFKVKGLDISPSTIDSLNRGDTLLIDEPKVVERLIEAREKQLFHAYTSVEEAVRGSAYIIIIIPVLFGDDGFADLKNLLELYSALIDVAEPGAVFIQESTLPPGTTSTVIKPVLEHNGKKSGIDFGLVFGPERTFSGRVIADIEDNYPKLLGGDTENATIAAKHLYSSIASKGVITLSNASTAEAVKSFKGAYRDANIAIANELAILADLHGLDILEIIDAANTEPFSHIHKPGIGVGGHCIPVYPRFLISQAEKLGYHPSILTEARRVNDTMVSYAVEKLSDYIDNWHVDILVMGLAYRGGVKELRLSPTLRLVPELKAKGANVTLVDPLYNIDEIDGIFGMGTGKQWSTSLISDYTIIIIVTDHQEFFGIEDLLSGKVVYDGRYILDIKQYDKITILQPGRIFRTNRS